MSDCAIETPGKPFRAGAARVCITPPRFPVPVGGAMLHRLAEGVFPHIYARRMALEGGTIRLALVVVDSCMFPRELLDRAKERAEASLELSGREIRAMHETSRQGGQD